MVSHSCDRWDNVLYRPFIDQINIKFKLLICYHMYICICARNPSASAVDVPGCYHYQDIKKHMLRSRKKPSLFGIWKVNMRLMG